MIILFLKLLLLCSFVFLYLFFCGFLFQIVHYSHGKTKIKRIKDERREYKQHNIFVRLLWDLPKQFIYDKFTIDPNTFSEYGLHLFCGEQGSGKTITMAYMIRRLKHIYPRLKVRTNFDCIYQDFSLTDWRELSLNTNGLYGELDCIDEIQNWFSTNASRNFPADMLTLITQQRKVRRCIFATSQVFTRISKPLRENTYCMYYPFTIFGCLTVVRQYRPVLDSEGNLKEKKLLKVFMFVHDKEIREAFDSYKTICTLTESGFYDKSVDSSGTSVK